MVSFLPTMVFPLVGVVHAQIRLGPLKPLVFLLKAGSKEFALCPSPLSNAVYGTVVIGPAGSRAMG